MHERRAMADPIEWYPARILQARAEGQDRAPNTNNTPDTPGSFALIVLNQPLRDVPTLKKLCRVLTVSIALEGPMPSRAAAASKRFT